MKIRQSGGLPGDRSIPLARLLDEEAMAVSFAQAATQGDVAGCRIQHVRYRPGEDCTVLYEVDLRMPDVGLETTWIHVRSGADLPVSASNGTDLPWVRGRLLAGPLPLPTLRAVGHEFPNDPRLPAIRYLADREHLASALADVIAAGAGDGRSFKGLGRNLRPIRYKPESRLVLRCRTRWHDRTTDELISERCLLRFERREADHTDRIGRRLEELSAAGAAFTVPALLFRAPKLGCSGTRWIEGDKLSRSLRRPETRAHALALTARALASLHEGAVPGLAVHGVEEALRAAAARLRRLTGYPLEVQRRLERLLRSAQRLAGMSAAGRQGTVHGDFHQGQVLLAGTRPCLLDLDRVHHGEIAADLGNFLAQLAVLDLRGVSTTMAEAGDQFVAAYEEETGHPLDRRRVALWSGVSLLELALKELRRLKPDWQERATAIADRGLEIIEGAQ